MKRSTLTAPLADRIRREAQPKSDLLQSMEDALKQYHQLADQERIDAAFGSLQSATQFLLRWHLQRAGRPKPRNFFINTLAKAARTERDIPKWLFRDVRRIGMERAYDDKSLQRYFGVFEELRSWLGGVR